MRGRADAAGDGSCATGRAGIGNNNSDGENDLRGKVCRMVEQNYSNGLEVGEFSHCLTSLVIDGSIQMLRMEHGEEFYYSPSQQNRKRYD